MSSLKFILGMPFSLRQRKLANSRSSISKQDFVDRAASSEIGKGAASLLWEKLKDAIVFDNFTPYPEDSLLHIYGLADEDLDDDIILDILKALDRVIPDEAALQKVGPIESPVDIVRLVESQPEKYEAGEVLRD